MQIRSMMAGVMMAVLAGGTLQAAPPATKPASPATTRPADPLEQRLDDVNTDGHTLAQVLTKLGQQTHLKLVIDWPKLNAAGVDPSRALHGRLMNARLKEVVQYLFGEAGGTGAVSLSVHGNQIDIAPVAANEAPGGAGEPAGPPSAVATRTFNVKKLLSIMAARQGRDATRAEVVDQLVKALETSIAADTWRDAGGATGTISVVGDALVITQTNDNLAKVEKLLANLEQTAGR